MTDEEKREATLKVLDEIITSRTGRKALELWKGGMLFHSAYSCDDNDIREAANKIQDTDVDIIYQSLSGMLLFCEITMRRYDNDSFTSMPIGMVMEVADQSKVSLETAARMLQALNNKGYKIK